MDRGRTFARAKDKATEEGIPMSYHWDESVNSNDFLSVTEISDVPVVVFVSTVRVI